MEISEQQLFEYISCPLSYSFMQKGIKKTSLSFNKMIYSVVKNLYLSTLDETYKSINPLKQKWDKVAMNNQLAPKKILEGWGGIINSYNYIIDNNIKFTGVMESYKLEIPGSKISILGQIDPYIDRGTHIELFISHFGKKQPDLADIDKKLKHTIDSYILQKRYNKEVIIRYHCFTTGNEYTSLRNSRDYNRMNNIIKNIGKALENDIIYPKETFMCSSCDYIDMCRVWGTK